MRAFFSVAIADGSIFAAFTWPVIFLALVIVLMLRPLAGMVGLAGRAQPWEEVAAIEFFRIRGLGSFYYLAYALGQAEFERTNTLWVTVSLLAVISVVLHDIAVPPVM